MRMLLGFRVEAVCCAGRALLVQAVMRAGGDVKMIEEDWDPPPWQSCGSLGVVQ